MGKPFARKHLTYEDLSVKCPPDKRYLLLWDDDPAGMGVRITKTKVCYFIQWRQLNPKNGKKELKQHTKPEWDARLSG
ncbi:hypothetical protein [Terasakiella sp. SH-1]|uniref:hypothetical protein n=1 Tax=Terasakiella sp. SH-1 TaxID=2560057 RepID=UPI00107370BA|nr:hypothetical protein [Terasakiella sp. SH-1]